MQSVVVALPEVLQFACGKCEGSFSLSAAQVSGRDLLFCPLCGHTIPTYEGLPVEVRRQIYHAIRNMIEQRVYEQRQIDDTDYFEDRANLPPA